MGSHLTELLYQEAPAISDWFTTEFEKLVPMSPNGKDRMLRFSWGCDVLEYIAGFWERRYGDSDHTPPKYVGRCRWVLEGYQPPDIFDEDEWKKDEHLLGPFPRTGSWDFIAFHVNNEQGYLPLDQSALNHVQIWAHWQSKGQKRSVEELLAAKHAMWAKRQQERDDHAATVAQTFGENVVKEFEKASETPSAFSLPKTDGYETTASGILIPKG